MKTVFVTLFEGIEGKNFIRTGVAEKLLRSGDVRIIFLLKDLERIAHYTRDVTDPRIVFAVAPLRPFRWYDRWLSRLKYTFFDTPTTRARTRLLFEQDTKRFHYWGKLFVSFVCGSRPFVSTLRMFEYAISRPYQYVELFAQYKPDLVVALDPSDDREAILLREAKKSGIRTFCFMNTWDRITNRSVIRIVPDEMFTFTEELASDVSRFHHIGRALIRAIGVPHYDVYGESAVITREQFLDRYQIPHNHKLVLYAPIGGTFSDSDWEMIDIMHRELALGSFGSAVSILVRFAPNDFIDKEELKKRPYMKYDLPGTRFATVRGSDWELSKDEMVHLRDTLAYTDLLACYASSLSVDAAIMNVPIINIDFELPSFARPGDKNYTKLPTKIYDWYHYRRALSTGGIYRAKSIGDMIAQANRYLADKNLDKVERVGLSRMQAGMVGGAVDRLAHFIRLSLHV